MDEPKDDLMIGLEKLLEDTGISVELGIHKEIMARYVYSCIAAFSTAYYKSF